MLPETWMVYCEAPMTVARMPPAVFDDRRAQVGGAAPQLFGQQRPEVAEGLLGARP